MITNSFRNYTLLEWNEQYQYFHMNSVQNGIADAQPDTNGYQTVYLCNSDEEAFLLIAYIWKYIKLETDTNRGLHLTTVQVKRHAEAIMKLGEDFSRLDIDKISEN